MGRLRLIIILLATIGLLASCGVKEKLEKHDKAQVDADFIMDNLGKEDIADKFPEKYFPKQDLRPFLENLTTKCDFETKQGKFVDFFTMNSNGKNQSAYIYEYILNCDSLRFIYIYDLDTKEPELFSFNIEGIEQPNKMIIDPKKQLLYSGTE